MAEIISTDCFNDLMIRNQFVIANRKVICGTCFGSCGQCGDSDHQYVCQRYLDHYYKNRPPLLTRIKKWFSLSA